MRKVRRYNRLHFPLSTQRLRLQAEKGTRAVPHFNMQIFQLPVIAEPVGLPEG